MTRFQVSGFRFQVARRSVVVAFAIALPLFAADTATKWTPAETLKYRLVSDVQVSPDGKRAAYVVREAAYEPDKSEWRTQIWLSSTDGKDARQATFADTSSSRPRWSPDGKWLGFLGKRGEPNVNVWLLPLQGGEARHLTECKSDVAQFEWSPDGTKVAFVAPDPISEEREKRDKAKDDAKVVDEEDRPGRLWIVTVEPDAQGRREARRLTSKFSVGGVPEAGGTNAMDWSPDGKTIAIVHTSRPTANDWPTADISLVDVATGTVRPFAATGASETSPRYSPDGQWIVYMATDDPPRWAHRNFLRLAPATGGPSRDLPHSFDESPEIAGWSADSQSIYFSEARHVSDVLYAQNLKTGAIHALTEEGNVSNGASVNTKGNWIGFVRQTPTDPTEAWVSPLSPFAPVKISDVNASTLPRHPLGETRTVSWTSPDGKTIEGLLTLPVGYEPDKKYPLLLVIHGGPAGVFKLTHIAMPGAYPVAALAAEGYAVLRANPRGSSGYGTAFRQANIKDWGGGDYADLMAGLDKVVGMGIADPDRLGVMGWSYGGFMTAWIVTQTNRFKAASIGAPVTDLISFTGTADIPSFVPDYFGGEFWDEGLTEVYRAHSAMGHIANAKTPALIQQGESDVRVPISQGYQLYNALKRRGVPVKMVTYPRQPHGIREPRLIQDVGERNIAWMAEWVLGKAQ